jgi:quercetin dioxygenase-like cupin family protein
VLLSNRIALLCLTAAAVMFLGNPAPAAEGPGTTSEVLLKTESSWDGTPYRGYAAGQPEVTVLKITIPPKTELAWHTHPMPNAAYVLSGELTVEKRDGGQTKQLKTGDVLPEMVNAVHRGRTGDNPVVLIVFYAGVKGQPLSEVAK